MTKLAFSSLLFSTLTSIFYFNLIPIHCSPVNGVVSSTRHGATPVEEIPSHYEQAGYYGTNNHIDRGTRVDLKHDLTSGNPLQEGQDPSWWQGSNLPNGVRLEECEDLLVSILTKALKIGEEEAGRTIAFGFRDLSESVQNDLFSENWQTCKKACRELQRVGHKAAARQQALIDAQKAEDAAAEARRRQRS